MRIPRSKVFRAFHELDCFTDEQCERFIRAAQRGSVKKTVGLHLKVLAALVGLGLAAGALFYVCRAMHVDPRLVSDTKFGVFLAVAILSGFGAASLSWLLARDWLLRWRIWRVINTRGSCAMCGYGLTGLRVAPDLRVTCPECGWYLATDPSLGEVVNVRPGADRFLPSPDVIPPILRWLTPKRKRLLKRLAIVVPSVVIALALVGWGGYEWFLHWQARIASADRQNPGLLLELIEKQQPTDTDGQSPDAWDSLDAAAAAIDTVDNQTWMPAYAQNRNAPTPNFSAISAPSSESSGEDAQRVAAERGLALKLIEDYRAAGVYAKLDELAQRPRAVGGVVPNKPGFPVQNMMIDHLHRARVVFRVNAARIRLASESGDLPEFRSAVEANLAIVRILRLRPFLLERFTASPIYMVTVEGIRDALSSRTGVEWVQAARGAIERQREDVAFESVLEAQELEALDQAAWLFGSPEHVRGGRLSATASMIGITAGAEDLSLGTYAENKRAITEIFEATSAEVKSEPSDRGRVIGPAVTHLLVVESQYGFVRKLSFVADMERMYKRGLDTIIALERYRGDTGSYPETLDALVPGYLPSLPHDPWSGRPFGYRHLEAAPGAPQRYLLYSVGKDGTDDGGRAAAEGNEMQAVKGEAPGTDFVLSPRWGRNP